MKLGKGTMIVFGLVGLAVVGYMFMKTKQPTGLSPSPNMPLMTDAPVKSKVGTSGCGCGG
jgi:hypothetical protein